MINNKTKLRNAFEDNMPTDIKRYKAEISKIIQFGRILGSLLRKIAGSLMKVAVPLAKDISAPISTIDAGIQKKIHSSRTTILIISNDGLNDILKIGSRFYYFVERSH